MDIDKWVEYGRGGIGHELQVGHTYAADTPTGS